MKYFVVTRDKEKNLNKGHTEGGDNYVFHSEWKSEQCAAAKARQLNREGKFQAKYILSSNFTEKI